MKVNGKMHWAPGVAPPVVEQEDVLVVEVPMSMTIPVVVVVVVVVVPDVVVVAVVVVVVVAAVQVGTTAPG